MIGTGLRVACRTLREALLSTAQTVQYEAANEVARQLGLADVAPEPFTARQQRQSCIDGWLHHVHWLATSCTGMRIRYGERS